MFTRICLVLLKRAAPTTLGLAPMHRTLTTAHASPNAHSAWNQLGNHSQAPCSLLGCRRAPCRSVKHALLFSRHTSSLSAHADLAPTHQESSAQLFTHSLSDEQAAAALAGDGHLRIIAGPGSGKTRVLTTRVEYLIREKGCKPSEMVVITFSNKAARELQERLQVLLGAEVAGRVVAGTFHSVGCQIVRRHVGQLGDTGRHNFAIFDQDDSKAAMKKALKQHFSLQTADFADSIPEAGAGDEDASSETAVLQEWEQPRGLDKLAKRFRHDISLLKNGVSTCFGLDGQAAIAKYRASSAALVNNLDKEFDLAVKAGITLEQAFDIYEAEMKQNRALDFDDLLGWPVALLAQCPAVRDRLQKRYKHILVDEFQDTNAPQYEMVRLLAGSQANVFVVGDPDQAIYGWRGANVVNMQKSFSDDYPGAQTLLLRDNYRSTPQVLRGAEGVLTNLLSSGVLPERVELNPLVVPGPQIEVIQVSDERAEADTVVSRMQQLHNEGRHKWKDMAILYRTNAQSRLFEEQLVKRNIPYQVVGGTPFWLRKEVKDVMAYVKLALNPGDDLSLMRAINQPTRGIGHESQVKLKAWAQSQSLTLGQALFPNYQVTTTSYEGAVPELMNGTPELLGWPETSQLGPTCDLPAKELGLSKKAAEGVNCFCKTIVMLRAMLRTHSLAPVLDVLLKHINYEEFILSAKSGKDKQQNRWQNVLQVLGAAEHAAQQSSVRGLDYLDTDHPTQEAKDGLARVQEFLEQVALWSEPEKAAAEEAQEGAADYVNVMTLHLSKGLEFSVVFIVGCEEALIPHGGLLDDMSDPRDVERYNEEVRLLYVGMTRAKEQLHLLHARQRSPQGGMQRFAAQISPFLKSIPGLKSHSQPASSGRITSDRYRYNATQIYRQSSSAPKQKQMPVNQHSTEECSLPRSAPVTPAQARAARRRR